jgi:hypothetical protein
LQKDYERLKDLSIKSLESTAPEPTRWQNAKLSGYMIAVALFFGVTLLISFFLVIVAINATNIPGDVAPSIFILGLAPPSIGTFLLFTRVFGRFL